MDIGHITQLVKGELGPHARVAYHQDLTRPNPGGPGNVEHLKTDTLGAGDFVFVDSGAANTHPTHDYRDDGLLLSTDRPLGASVNIGEWAAAKVQGLALPPRFVCVANFNRPVRAGLTGGPGVGIYAPTLLMNTAATGPAVLMGVTCQFQPEGIRMNLPGVGVMANRPVISQSLADRIQDVQHPETFSLALAVDRSSTPAAGKGFFFVGNLEADSLAFDFGTLPASASIADIRAGIGTRSGDNYRASVFLLDFQIWS